ncbi:MAG: hypothetical protein GAK34_03377 [Delftia tsuruhatensis]|nr:MAG: hypothetical protein GAK34_03377 [Delftia tsuruhatensis]
MNRATEDPTPPQRAGVVFGEIAHSAWQLKGLIDVYVCLIGSDTGEDAAALAGVEALVQRIGMLADAEARRWGELRTAEGQDEWMLPPSLADKARAAAAKP